jgi:hypothetical protein
MPELSFLIHLPLLRIEQEYLPFDAGQLWRVPFERYDRFSLGAFSEQQKQYEATEPVFLTFSVPVPEDGLERRAAEVKGMPEIKAPSSRRALLGQLGLGFLDWGHDTFGTPAWTALLLSTPAAALAPPRWSQTFASIDDGFTISIAGQPATAARVQGEADHEYLFLPDAPSKQIPSARIARAAGLVDAVRAWEQIPDLHAALSALRATGSPILSPQDRLTICIQALESLLLPEVQTTLKKTFARRVTALLASDPKASRRLTDLAANLYTLRSESIHGGELPDNSAALEGSFGEQLLAGAILGIGQRISAGQSLDTIRAQLDQGVAGAPAPANPFEIEQQPAGRASEYRLARRVPSYVGVGLSTMTAPENTVCCWSPLLGLGTEGLTSDAGMLLGDTPTPVLMPLSPMELYDLEERDIRRDFMAEFTVQGYPMAVLLTMHRRDDAADPGAQTPQLERIRDLGVVALRLAGYDRFHDPELFGSAVFEGTIRLRRPTALRQTIIEEVRHEPTQHIGPSDQARVAELWRILRGYETSGRAAEIEYVLSLFRRSFDRDFFEPEQRALMLIGQLEAMLGRFRPPKDRVQLEELVTALLGESADVGWFRASGRAFRNRVAHGGFTTDDVATLETLSRVVSGVVLELLRTWSEPEAVARRGRPSDLLIRRATSLVSAPV